MILIFEKMRVFQQKIFFVKTYIFALQAYFSVYYAAYYLAYMIKFLEDFSPWNTYTNTGNIFSKSLLLQGSLKSKKTLFVVNESKKRISYENTFNYLWLAYIYVDTYASLLELCFWEDGLYIVDQSFFEEILVSQHHFDMGYSYSFSVWDTLSFNRNISSLWDLGYVYSEFGKKGSYKKLGDMLHIYPPFSQSYFFRLSFFDDELEKIECVSASGHALERDRLKLGKIEKLSLHTLSTQVLSQRNPFSTEVIQKFQNPATLLQDKGIQIVADALDFYQYKQELQETFPETIFLDAIKNTQKKTHDAGIHELYIDDLASLTEKLQDTQFWEKYIFTKNKTTLDNFLNYNNISRVKVIDCRIKQVESFYTDFKHKNNILVIGDDNLNRVFVKKRVKRSFSKDLDLLVHIKEWDYITHIDHGVGIFQGIIKRELSINNRKIVKEFLELQYLDNDKLFIPITEVKRVSKFIGNENPKLTNLGTKEWSKKLKRVSQEVEDIATELLDIFAKRQLKKWYQFEVLTQKIDAFQGSFPYAYTDDQQIAIDEILTDMQSIHPMDRLLNGDVGFWKTEVCFNAIYNAFCNKKQSILLTPLVVLAYEHYEKALERFADFGMKIWVLTRFEKSWAVQTTLAALKKWELDLVIGTHKLLSREVEFQDLWLVVIDEEHKFGVKDKERIKELKGQIDILSLSATPIPRSLNMALNWLKQVSILRTPPYGRKAIETYVSRFSDEVIVDACRHEFERGGQVFFIHNRVENIEAFQNYLQTLFPHKSIIVTHGQLPGDELEKRIIAFRSGDYDMLLSTTVIENGVDFSNVNTIFINEAYKFWISQIHQLRGRVGRAQRQWYCYLLYRNENINEEAEKRLKTIVDYSHLWAGFELAMRDLEIRGGGEILGKKQSGQVAEVWISIFIQMLEEKIEEMKRVREYKAKKELENIDIIGWTTHSQKDLTPALSWEERENNDSFVSSSPWGEELRWGLVDQCEIKVNTSIDLNISAYIPDDFFGSSMDKMNFYRELESVDNIEDLELIIEGFVPIASPQSSSNASPQDLPVEIVREREINDREMNTPPDKGDGGLAPETQNLFDLLRLKFAAGKLCIASIKKNGQNYQLDFASPEWHELEILRAFLDLDREVRFTVTDPKRLRAPVKKFGSDLAFLQYLKQIIWIAHYQSEKIGIKDPRKKKIKLKKRP